MLFHAHLLIVYKARCSRSSSKIVVFRQYILSKITVLLRTLFCIVIFDKSWEMYEIGREKRPLYRLRRKEKKNKDGDKMLKPQAFEDEDRRCEWHIWHQIFSY